MANIKKLNNLRNRRKEALIILAGGACVRCGFSGHRASFDFHHVVPKNKLYNISQLFGKSDAEFEGYAVPEAREKCVLLCKNCHALIHADEEEFDAIYYKWEAAKQSLKDSLE